MTRSLRVLATSVRVLAASLTVLTASLTVLAAPAAGQGRFTNARTETRSAAQGLDREVRAIAARGGAAWIGYRAPMTASQRHMCCYDNISSAGNCCGICRLENGSGVTMTTGDGQINGTRIALEPPTEFIVMARVEAGSVMRIRTFTPDCDVDAGNMAVVWLNDVKADESVSWLTSLIEFSGTNASSTDYRNRVAKPALAALAIHNTRSALTTLVRISRESRDTRMRSDGLFWLAQRAGQEAVATIADAIERDPETEVKKKAVFALSQLPHDEGVPKLLEIARTHRNPEVRKQAFFWLGQTKDPRAIQFFEEILLKK